jgi:hypothetical protein
LNTTTLEEIIQDCKKKWHNENLRMDSSRLTQKVKNCQPDGRRNIGRLRRNRPIKTYLEVYDDDDDDDEEYFI